MKTWLKIFLGLALTGATILALSAHAADDKTAPAAAIATPPAPAPVPAPATATAPVAAKLPAPAPAVAYYNYANDEAEYSVMLPEAPSVQTLWRESYETTPYLDNPPTDMPTIGEVATFKRIDIDTEEMFDAKITFIKARKTFIDDLNKEKMKDILLKQYKGKPLTNEEFKFSQGQQTLKWAAYSGFTLDAHNHPAFYAIHYLTGLQSIMVIEVTYSLENKTYGQYYETLVNSITYSPP